MGPPHEGSIRRPMSERSISELRPAPVKSNTEDNEQQVLSEKKSSLLIIIISSNDSGSSFSKVNVLFINF